MENQTPEPFLGQLIAFYESAAFPCAILDENFRVSWCSETAREHYPGLALPDGALTLLAGYLLDDVRREIAAKGRFVAWSAGVFTGPPTVVCALPGGDETAQYLLQASLLSPQGTGMQPKGTSLALSAFGAQYRTPLTALFSALTLLRDQNDQNPDTAMREQMQQNLEFANANAYQVLRSCDWISYYARLTQQLWPPVKRRIEIFSWLRLQCETAAGIAEPLGIPVTCNLPEEPLVICCDIAKLSATLFNLFSNSLRYTREGNAIEVKARRLRNAVSISVADKGAGLSMEAQSQVFQPFFSYGSSGNPFPGNGLGLAIAKGCVAALGGTITLVSEEGVGTTVLFTITAEDDPAAPEAMESTPSQYLSDRFSPIRIALSDAVPPPL